MKGTDFFWMSKTNSIIIEVPNTRAQSNVFVQVSAIKIGGHVIIIDPAVSSIRKSK